MLKKESYQDFLDWQYKTTFTKLLSSLEMVPKNKYKFIKSIQIKKPCAFTMGIGNRCI